MSEKFHNWLLPWGCHSSSTAGYVLAREVPQLAISGHSVPEKVHKLQLCGERHEETQQQVASQRGVQGKLNNCLQWVEEASISEHGFTDCGLLIPDVGFRLVAFLKIYKDLES